MLCLLTVEKVISEIQEGLNPRVEKAEREGEKAKEVRRKENGRQKWEVQLEPGKTKKVSLDDRSYKKGKRKEMWCIRVYISFKRKR